MNALDLDGVEMVMGLPPRACGVGLRRSPGPAPGRPVHRLAARERPNVGANVNLTKFKY